MSHSLGVTKAVLGGSWSAGYHQPKRLKSVLGISPRHQRPRLPPTEPQLAWWAGTQTTGDANTRQHILSRFGITEAELTALAQPFLGPRRKWHPDILSDTEGEDEV